MIQSAGLMHAPSHVYAKNFEESKKKNIAGSAAAARLVVNEDVTFARCCDTRGCWQLYTNLHLLHSLPQPVGWK